MHVHKYIPERERERERESEMRITASVSIYSELKAKPVEMQF